MRLGAEMVHQVVGLGELVAVADGVGAEGRGVFEDGLDPLGILLQE